MKINMKWLLLTDSQKEQIKSFYDDELKSKRMFEHDLNRKSFLINITDGSFVSRKDF